MNVCKNCGKEFVGNFCPSCGTKFTALRICGHCGEEVVGDFCTKCGTRYTSADDIKKDFTEDDSADVSLSSPKKSTDYGLGFSVTNGCSVWRCSRNSDEDIVIPEENNGSKVRWISEGAFKNLTKIRSVTIPEGVTFIGDEAFANCKSLRYVVIPGSVKYIGKRAFSKCSHLRYVFYGGEEFRWDDIKVRSHNSYLRFNPRYARRTKYFYGKPDWSKRHWIYDSDGRIEIYRKAGSDNEYTEPID
ncbi:MAG: leucine-rich repeat protein [Bacteroidales bacterium]|nr:leucine-rich repeat protein [Bacteroidales bacterium]